MLKILSIDKKMAPAAAPRHSGHMVEVLQKNPTIKSQFSCPVSRNLKRESERLKTFKNWPVSFLDPRVLAKNGFYYTQTDDVVKCIFCKIQIGFWEEGDDPAEDHKREREDCPFVKNESCGNIPISEDEEDDYNNSSENDISQDVCGFSDLVLKPFSEPERLNQNSIVIDSSNLWKDFEELGVSKIYRPVSPNYATYASRIKTFEKWKSHDIQKPENLAEAGFYYIGIDDNVLCFHCGGGLKNWEKNDDPWVEHARWFSKCRFVFHHKGREFINEVAIKSSCSFTSESKESVNNSKNYPEDNSSKSDIQKSKDSKNIFCQSASILSSSSCSSTSTSTSTSSLNKEKLPLDDSELKMCRICFARERGIVFLPCGHFVCCPQCTPSLSTCAVCREPFKATVRAYLS